jgi:hypothetical protein
MRSPAIWFAGVSCLWMVAGCATGQTVTRAGLPEFVMPPLKAQNVEKVKLYLRPDGSFRKFSVYAARQEALPEWVSLLADEKIGKGESKEFEIEQYENGDQCYELTRVINGKSVEMSVKLDRSVGYLEKQIAPEEIPAPVKAAIDKIEGFQLQEAEVKEAGAKKTYEVEGKIKDAAWEIELDDSGQILTRSLEVKTELMVDQ